MDIKVVNKKFLGDPLPNRFREYVGRPSSLGNPFSIGEHGNRKDVILKYKKWFYNNLGDENIRKCLRKLKGKALKGCLELICWCAPFECHAEVIREFLVLEDEGGIYRLASHVYKPPYTPYYDDYKDHFFKIDHSHSSKYPEEHDNEWSDSYWLICLDDSSVKVKGYIDYEDLEIWELR